MQVVDDVRSLAVEATRKSRFAVLIMLDVGNAFNTLRWDVIHRELEAKNFPEYLKGFVKGYFRERTVRYYNNDETIEWPVEIGVPQGPIGIHIIGPLL